VFLDECAHIVVYRCLKLILRCLNIGHDHLFPLEFFFQYLSLICFLLLESLSSQVHLLDANFSLLFGQLTLVYLLLAYYLFWHDRQPTFTVELFLFIDLNDLTIYNVNIRRLPNKASNTIGDFCVM
jgi:hypothetical protein